MENGGTVRLGGLIYEATGEGGGLETLGWVMAEVSDWKMGGECLRRGGGGVV